jgi:hypothetical protein
MWMVAMIGPSIPLLFCGRLLLLGLKIFSILWMVASVATAYLDVLWMAAVVEPI